MANALHLEEISHPTALLFGGRLKARRKALKLTQVQLFERTGITPGYLSFIENGRANPTLDMMVKLSEAVDTNLCKMLCEPEGESAS